MLERTLDVPASADELWAAITDPDELATWLGDEVTVDLRPGGTGVVVDGDEERHLRVDEVDEGQRWAFTWWPAAGPQDIAATSVELVVLPRVGGSRLIVRESLPAAVQASRPTSRWDLRLALVGLQITCRARL